MDAAARESYTTHMPQADSLELVPLMFAFRCDRLLRVDQSWVQVARYDAVAARSVDARELISDDVARAWRMLGICRKRHVTIRVASSRATAAIVVLGTLYQSSSLAGGGLIVLRRVSANTLSLRTLSTTL